jgi:uroporphyrinogen-III synthase
MPVVLVLRRHDGFSEILEKSGITVINLELIRTEPLDDQAELSTALNGPVRYDGFFVTSSAAAHVLLDRLRELDCEHTGMIYVLGERSRRILQDGGINVEFCQSANTAEELITEFGEAEFAGKRFCFVRGDRSMRTIPHLLKDIAAIDEVIVYRTIESAPDLAVAGSVKAGLDAGEIDWACFFSPSAVDAFEKIFGRRRIPGLKAAVIGETTAERAREIGFDVAFVSPSSNAEAFAESFAEQVNKN